MKKPWVFTIRLLYMDPDILGLGDQGFLIRLLLLPILDPKFQPIRPLSPITPKTLKLKPPHTQGSLGPNLLKNPHGGSLKDPCLNYVKPSHSLDSRTLIGPFQGFSV